MLINKCTLIFFLLLIIFYFTFWLKKKNIHIYIYIRELLFFFFILHINVVIAITGLALLQIIREYSEKEILQSVIINARIGVVAAI